VSIVKKLNQMAYVAQAVNLVLYSPIFSTPRLQGGALSSSSPADAGPATSRILMI